MTETCESCGDDVEQPIRGNENGAYCFDCASSMPKCDDCDVVIEDGDYHLCTPCLRRREP